jgi:N-sulfoglucosamine sulfohydrolase
LRQLVVRPLALSGALIAVALLSVSAARAAESPLNVLLITADDMNFDAPGFAGSAVPDITPNLDRLAREGLGIVNAHVAVAVCQPSRECLMTGRYPHRNGATGFYSVRPDVPTLMEELRAAGYRLGILGQVTHLKPNEKFP